MKCQNVQIGESLYHSIKAAASKKWPAFGTQSMVLIDWFTKRRIRIPAYPFDPISGIAEFKPIGIPELPHNVQFDYNEVSDILLIALRPGSG